MPTSTTEAALKNYDPLRIPGASIDTDRPCPRCGYNLKGLVTGGNCPECGRPIFFGLQARPDHHLSDAPYWYLRLTQAALWLVFLSAFAAFGMIGLHEFGHRWTTLFALCAGAWLASLAALCIPRPYHRTEGVPLPQIPGALKAVVVGSQFLWLPVIGLSTGVVSGAWAQQTMWILTACAGAGVIAAMALLAHISEFAGDSDRGRMLKLIASVLVVVAALWAAGLRMRINIPLPILSALQEGVPLLAYAIPLVAAVFLWHLFQLAVVGGWTVQVARHQDERDEQLRERFRREQAAGAAWRDNEPFGGPVQKPLNSMMGIKPTRRS